MLKPVQVGLAVKGARLKWNQSVLIHCFERSSESHTRQVNIGILSLGVPLPSPQCSGIKLIVCSTLCVDGVMVSTIDFEGIDLVSIDSHRIRSG